MGKIDTEWFVKKIKKSKFGSQRQLARHIKGRQGPLDPAALSLALSGQRALQLGEVVQLASLLHVPLVDVLSHCGVR